MESVTARPPQGLTFWEAIESRRPFKRARWTVWVIPIEHERLYHCQGMTWVPASPFDVHATDWEIQAEEAA